MASGRICIKKSCTSVSAFYKKKKKKCNVETGSSFLDIILLFKEIEQKSSTCNFNEILKILKTYRLMISINYIVKFFKRIFNN